MAASCLTAALRLLKIRPRSIDELRRRLVARDYPEDEVHAVIDRLTGTGLLNDRAFTESWIAYRLARPFGFGRIAAELKLKGVAEDVIAEAISAVKPNVDDVALAMAIARRRYERLDDLEPQKRRKRVFDLLLRRGFGAAVAMKVMRAL